MKLDKLVGERFRERPNDCAADSHALMVRGGYMKQVANGIFSSCAPLRRVTRKIEQIIREEMDAIGGQEVLFPVAMPASLWGESGRYESVGSELLRFSDRNGVPMVLGMTHEEAAVHLVREYGGSYAKYPFMIYQIQTKFRDEARPRGGLIRVREFIMKDAYSFHTSQEDLEMYFESCFHAYKRIFTRVGLPEVIPIMSDSGMMGGSMSSEFMLLTPVGEDSVVTCGSCDYRANMEAAECIVDGGGAEPEEPLKKVHTPSAKTIEEVCALLGLPPGKSCKAVVYEKDGGYIAAFIRGDLEINETKLANILGGEIRSAELTEDGGLAAGFIGPHRLEGAELLFDRSLEGAKNLICGANEADYHYTGFNAERDYGPADYHDFAKAVQGGICPACGKPSLEVSRGVELGHIFQLGTKYTRAMDMRYAGEDGDLRYPLMGCYGIGIGRLAACVCEARHDEYGPLWPMAIAPWQVHLCCLRADDGEVRACADRLYEALLAEKIEVIYDDRAVSAGVMFSDADLLGVPVRVIASPRNMAGGCCEIVTRDTKVRLKVKIGEAVEAVKKLVEEMLE